MEVERSYLRSQYGLVNGITYYDYYGVGSNRVEATNALDLRLEKIFKVGSGGDRLPVYADITNLWNASTILTVNRRYPSLGIAGFDDPIEFEAPPRSSPRGSGRSERAGVSRRADFRPRGVSAPGLFSLPGG